MDNKELILKEAHKLYKEKGYSQVTINDICQNASISKPTFYKYFKNKEDTIVNIYEYITNEIVEDVPTLILAKSCYDQLSLCFTALINQSIGIGYDLISQMFKINLDEDNGSFDFQRRFSDVCIAITKRGQEMGEFQNPAPPEDLYKTLCFAFTGFELTWCIKDGKFDFSEQVETAIRVIYCTSPRLS